MSPPTPDVTGLAGPAYPPVRSTSTGAAVVTVLVGAWVVGVTVLSQVLGWGIDQLLLVAGLDRPWWAWPALSLANGGLAGLPALLLARRARAASVRAAGWSWCAGAVAVTGLGALRVVPASRHEFYLVLLTVGCTGLAAAWRWIGPGSRAGADQRPSGPASGAPASRAVSFAFAGGLVVLLPWLWIGALGGALETVLAVLAAAAVGWLAATLLASSTDIRTSHGGPRSSLAHGLVVAVTLLLVAGGVGASGAQLPLLLILPALGFAAATLLPRSTYAPPTRLALVALLWPATLGPLALVDPEEITILLAISRDVPFWTVVATGCSLLLGLLISLTYLLGQRWSGPRWSGPRWSGPRWSGPRWVATAVAGLLVITGAAIHLGAGQPGLHGERLFVIMAEQADLSDVPTGTGQAARDARAEEVYQRLVTHAATSQADLHTELDRLRLPYTPYYLVNAVEVTGGPAVRGWLSRRDDVDRVLRSQRLRPLPALHQPAAGIGGPTPDNPEWNVAMVGADRVWEEFGTTGAGIIIGTSDSGVDGSHPALAGGFRGGGDSWLDPWHGTTTPSDRTGHGTHTLGSAVGTGGIGVAPGAEWTGCVNLDRNLGNPALYLDCLQFMLAPYPAGGDPWTDGRPGRAPHVLTNSWACPPIEGCDETALRPATEALRAAGLYVVAAAGNTGPFCESIDDPPAPYPDVLTVGAVDQAERLASFSSRGPVADAEKPDLVAPGVAVLSAMPGGGYARLSGTSMATPQVAGVVALMWSANPALIGDVAATTNILRETSRPVPVDQFTCGGPAALVGAGLVDAHSAVAAAGRTAPAG